METLYSIRRAKLKERRKSLAISRLGKAVETLYSDGAKRVIVFGSVLKPGSFNERSDVDIAVEGIPEGRRLEVEGELVDIFGDIEFDIIFLEERENVRPEILERIEKEGELWRP